MSDIKKDATQKDDAELLDLLAKSRQRRVQELSEIIQRESARLRCDVVGVVEVSPDGRLVARARIVARD